MKMAAVLLMAAVAAAPSPEPRYARFQRDLQIPPQASGQTCLVIDPGLFAHAAAQLADLRLYRSDGQTSQTETPYVLRVAAPAESAQQSLTPLNLGQRNGQTVFDAAMPAGSYADIELGLTGQNFLAAVTVSGSQAQTGSPETHLGAYTVFDFTRQKLGRSTVLHLPKSDFRFLHFQIDGSLPPASVTGLTVMSLPVSQPRYVTVAGSSRVTQREHRSVVEFTVPAHTPVDRILFSPRDQPANFSRDVRISAVQIAPARSSDDTALPAPATAYGNLLRVHRSQEGHRIDEERLAIDAPQVDFDTPAKWTILIDNGDDAPVQLDSVRLQMLERDLCFDAAPAASYTLFYGDPALAAPHYDYAALFSPQDNAIQSSLGSERANPSWQSRPDDRPFTEKHPALLWAVLILVVALLGFIALHSAKRGTPTQAN